MLGGVRMAENLSILLLKVLKHYANGWRLAGLALSAS